MLSRNAEVARENHTLFVEAYEQVDPFTNEKYDVCPAMHAGYEWVDDDPKFPPYTVPALYCMALIRLLHPEQLELATSCIPF